MVQLTETQRVRLSAKFKTKNGNPAPVEPGSVRWAVLDTATATATPDPATELDAILSAKAPGATQAQCTADADLGDGVRTVTLTLDVVVTPGGAVGGEIEVGTPEEQPEA